MNHAVDDDVSAVAREVPSAAMDARALSVSFLFLAVTPVLASCGAGSCPEGAFRDEAAGFCLVLPAVFAKDKQEESPLGQRFNFKGADYGFMTVTVLKGGADELKAQKTSLVLSDNYFSPWTTTRFPHF